ncbi:hypothetical protein [Labrenzia sp. VG12]|uniref:hypothetical protein n=1 Tax=Labrenzia sp. VG12 TaxID=2021862 RepID=UPI0012FDB2F9|nr:hypothetical protein [Labrenzia sp. VG12]
MKLDRTMKRNFPNLSSWISREIPKVKSNPQIFDAFVKYSQLSKSAATEALSFNNKPPTIDAAVMRSYGQYRPRFAHNRNKVFLNRRLCREFNKIDPDIRTGKPWDLILKATLLHEMVHWGDYVADGVRQPNGRIYDTVKGAWMNDVDVGFQFEIEAFYAIYTREFL